MKCSPAASTEDAVLEWVPSDITVTVTAIARQGTGSDLGPRRAADRAGLTGWSRTCRPAWSGTRRISLTSWPRLTADGVDDVFVPAGDADPPAGPFDSALRLLDRLAEMGSPFTRVGVTGYPESHPKIDDDITIQAMWDKRHHATYLVSNLCFNPATIRKWIARVRARGVTLPLFVGIAGPVDRTRLVRMATKACGRRVGQVPGRAHRVVPAPRHARRLQPGPAAGTDRCHAGRTRLGRRGPARVHVQTRSARPEQWRRALLERLAEHQGAARNQGVANRRRDPGEETALGELSRGGQA